MVKRSPDLDLIFQSLADPTRRDILRRGAKKDLSISELARPYKLSLPAISKHIRVLEKAHLVTKERRGKQYFVHISLPAFSEAMNHLKEYEKLWNERFDRLERYLSTFPT